MELWIELYDKIQFILFLRDSFGTLGVHSNTQHYVFFIFVDNFIFYFQAKKFLLRKFAITTYQQLFSLHKWQNDCKINAGLNVAQIAIKTKKKEENNTYNSFHLFLGTLTLSHLKPTNQEGVHRAHFLCPIFLNLCPSGPMFTWKFRPAFFIVFFSTKNNSFCGFPNFFAQIKSKDILASQASQKN